MLEYELKVLRKELDDLLAKGLIRPFTSPARAPILYVPKKEPGKLRKVSDYRGINAITVRDQYPIPLIRELQDRLREAQWYTKLDEDVSFHLVRMAEGEEWKTAFGTRYGSFEWLVMPMGLTNAPATQQRLGQTALGPYLDVFVILYIDDILIYSTTLEEHRDHVRKVLTALREYDIRCNPKKCVFHVQEVEFLGHIVTPEGFKMDPEKVRAIQEWPEPKNVKNVQEFLGFCNFYRSHAGNYSEASGPLTNYTKKDVPFDYESNDEAQKAWRAVKALFTIDKILAHFMPDLKTRVEADASDKALGTTLSQLHANGK